MLSLLSSHERAETFIEQPAVNADALMAAAGADPLVGQRLGHYQIRRLLGEGGMGIVYLADDTRLGREVALKAVRAQFADDPARRARLEREAQAAAALTHPGIATVYALEEFDGRLFISSEYVAGETLRTELGRGPLSGTRLLETAIGIAQPLAAAHARGVVHRDLKPENVIRTPEGAIKILDFGLARLQDRQSRDQAITTQGTLLGTPAYMSPEQIRATDVDFRSDLFSFGIVVYELATGVNPFTGGDPASTIARILEVEPARLAERVPVSSANTAGLGALTRVVTTCLQKDRNARYRSTRELEAALDAARGAGAAGAAVEADDLVVAVSPGAREPRLLPAADSAGRRQDLGARPAGGRDPRRRFHRRARRRHAPAPPLVHGAEVSGRMAGAARQDGALDPRG